MIYSISNRFCIRVLLAIRKRPTRWSRVSTTWTNTWRIVTTQPVTSWRSPTLPSWPRSLTWKVSIGRTNRTRTLTAGWPSSRAICPTTTNVTKAALPCSRTGSNHDGRQRKRPRPPKRLSPSVKTHERKPAILQFCFLFIHFFVEIYFHILSSSTHIQH